MLLARRAKWSREDRKGTLPDSVLAVFRGEFGMLRLRKARLSKRFAVFSSLELFKQQANA